MILTGIQNRILFIALAPVLVLGIALTAWYTKNDINQQTEAFVSRTETAANRLADTLSLPMQEGRSELIQTLLRRALSEPDARAIRLFDSSGIEWLASGPTMGGQERQTPVTETMNLTRYRSDSTLRYLTPVYNPSDLQRRMSTSAPAGWLEIEFDYANTKVAHYQAVLINLLLLSLGLAAACGLAGWLSREISRPVRTIISTLDAIRKGNPDARVDFQANGEMHDLVDGINSTTDTLRDAYEEMQNSSEQATKDLHETLETIEIQNIELDMARREAQQANQVKTEFLANMSHEIRTPLNGIIGFAKLLEKSSLTRQQEDYISTILSSSQGLLTIINDVLDFCKMEAGKLMLDNRSTNLRETIDDVLVMLAPAFQAKQLEVVSLYYTDVPEQVVTDPLRVKQVLTNLVNNAIKFTPSGSIVVRTMIEQVHGDRMMVRISVTDTGIGLSKTDQKALFHAFTQADSSTAREFGGTGLGLVISKRLVEQMGGDIGLESQKDEGSTFWFNIKAKAVSDDQQTQKPVDLEGFTLAIVEPREMSQLALRHQAEQWGMECLLMNTLDDLQAHLSQQDAVRPNMALVDVSSFENDDTLYRQIVHIEQELHCQILVLATTRDGDISGKLLDQGAEHYLPTPIRYKRLYKTLVSILRPEKAVATGEPSPTTPGKALPNLRVLAVDDNPANLKLIVTLLESIGVQVDGACNGEEAVTAAHQAPYDLIFMDIQMPGMDGKQATRRIRQAEPPQSHTPIIALTAHALGEEQQSMLECGMDEYLTKPVDEDQLYRTLFKWTGTESDVDIAPAIAAAPHVEKPPSIDIAKLHALPVVDFVSGLKKANGKLALARDMFSMLIGSIEQDQRQMNSLYHQGDYEALQEDVHRLHGATHYCGIPRIQMTVQYTESLLKLGGHPSLLEDALFLLNEEINDLQRWLSEHSWEKTLEQSVKEYADQMKQKSPTRQSG